MESVHRRVLRSLGTECAGDVWVARVVFAAVEIDNVTSIFGFTRVG